MRTHNERCSYCFRGESQLLLMQGKRMVSWQSPNQSTQMEPTLAPYGWVGFSLLHYWHFEPDNSMSRKAVLCIGTFDSIPDLCLLYASHSPHLNCDTQNIPRHWYWFPEDQLWLKPDPMVKSSTAGYPAMLLWFVSQAAVHCSFRARQDFLFPVFCTEPGMWDMQCMVLNEWMISPGDPGRWCSSLVTLYCAKHKPGVVWWEGWETDLHDLLPGDSKGSHASSCHPLSQPHIRHLLQLCCRLNYVAPFHSYKTVAVDNTEKRVFSRDATSFLQQALKFSMLEEKVPQIQLLTATRATEECQSVLKCWHKIKITNKT